MIISAAEKSSSRLKKEWLKTSKSTARARSGSASRSSSSAAVMRVEGRVRPDPVELQQRRGEHPVGVPQVAQPQAGRAGQQREQVDRRQPGQRGEVLGRPLPGEHRVAAERAEEAELRVDPAQQRAPGVVLPEEAVEAVLDPLRRAVGEPPRPGAEPAAEVVGGLQQRDPHAALGEHDGGGDAGDPAADHHRGGRRRHPPRPVGPRRHHRPRPHPQQPAQRPSSTAANLTAAPAPASPDHVRRARPRARSPLARRVGTRTRANVIVRSPWPPGEPARTAA